MTDLTKIVDPHEYAKTLLKENQLNQLVELTDPKKLFFIEHEIQKKEYKSKLFAQTPKDIIIKLLDSNLLVFQINPKYKTQRRRSSLTNLVIFGHLIINQTLFLFFLGKH